jgi:asparagine N-glycosylation enzyme membrane subunit Stt3
MKPTWPAAFVALGFLALLGMMFWRATDSNEFTTIWASIGTVVGVVVGAIPSFFFKAQAADAQVQLSKASAKAMLYAAAAPPENIARMLSDHPELGV